MTPSKYKYNHPFKNTVKTHTLLASNKVNGKCLFVIFPGILPVSLIIPLMTNQQNKIGGFFHFLFQNSKRIS